MSAGAGATTRRRLGGRLFTLLSAGSLALCAAVFVSCVHGLFVAYYAKYDTGRNGDAYRFSLHRGGVEAGKFRWVGQPRRPAGWTRYEVAHDEVLRDYYLHIPFGTIEVEGGTVAPQKSGTHWMVRARIGSSSS